MQFWHMIAIVLRWHQAMSWKLGHRHACQGRPYNLPWWGNEAHYALAYTYAKFIDAHSGQALQRPFEQEIPSAL
jgi:hypothetical protein